jgi:hypothetical protein
MSRSSVFALLLVILFLAVIVPPHIIGIDKFATIDEPWWVISGSNYYYALTHRDFDRTIYDYHPAVTTTWVVTAGMLSYFPEYRGFGQGYFDVRKNHFDNFLHDHGKLTSDLLRNSRLIQAATIILMSLIGFLLLQKIMNPGIAFLAVALAMDAPYFLGHSRLLNHEGMLAIFILVSILGLLVYLRERKFVYLLISSVAFGLAQLTKSSSIVVLGVAGWMIFISLLDKEGEKKPAAKLLAGIKTLGLWLIIAATVYVILWPGMWAAPGKMLFEVYGNALSYAFQGARLEALQDTQPARYALNLNLAGIAGYLQLWLLRSTPITWLGVFLALPVMIARSVESTIKWLIGCLALTAFLVIAMFGIAQGRDSTHYILTSFVCLDVIAGLGWGFSLGLAAEHWAALYRPAVKITALTVLIGLQIGSLLPFYPYYFTYKNPVMSGIAGSKPYGYGEGLELAAAYLAQKPDASATRAFVYAGMGPFSYFYPGETEVLKKAYLLERGLPSIIIEMRKAEYLVVYSAVQDYQPESREFLSALSGVQPEHEITIRGSVAARIYRISEIPESVYEKMAE